jgi:hypothetical protein
MDPVVLALLGKLEVSGISDELSTAASTKTNMSVWSIIYLRLADICYWYNHSSCAR